MAKFKNGFQAKPSIQKLNDEEILVEHCMNPWNSGCKNTDIVLYIIYEGKKIPVCWKCWRKISRGNIVWEAY